MQDGFKVEKSKSLEDEIVLDIIEKITEGIGGKFSTKAHKLLSKIKNEDFNPIYTKLNIEDISDRFADIQVLETAIKEKREVECSYSDERYDIYATTIQPLKIVNFEGFWYLLALRDDVLKKYYLKNISNPKMTDFVFTIDNKLDTLLDRSISVWFQKDVLPFEVVLYADKVAAKYFKRRPLPTQKIESLNTDGTMEFSVEITHEMEILPIVKYWIPHLFVIEPEWVQQIAQDDLEVYAEKMAQIKE
jgi:predicted DNA-binding transcriptional regulator YafY